MNLGKCRHNGWPTTMNDKWQKQTTKCVGIVKSGMCIILNGMVFLIEIKGNQLEKLEKSKGERP